MRNRSQYYKLIGRLPVPIRDIYRRDANGNPLSINTDPAIVKEFTEAFAFASRLVASTDIGPMHVSTVFLVMDHQYSIELDAPPILFETMIFGDNEDSYQERYSTWDEAEKGHARAVEYAEKLLAKAQTMLEPSQQ